MAFEIRNIGEALDLETGQVVALTPDYIKQLDDETLAQFIYESKRFAKLPKAGEEELKSRLESGKRFSMVDFGRSSLRDSKGVYRWQAAPFRFSLFSGLRGG